MNMDKVVKASRLIFAALILFTFVGLSPAEASSRCQVTDPTGTPLNVRARPNGRVINRLRNGRQVVILRMARDTRGRPWAYVGGYYKGQWREWGWVFREFISCW